MLETIFFILILSAIVFLAFNVFKSVLKIAVILLILIALLFFGRRLFGDDWLTDKIRTNQKSSKHISI
ncbi:MAG: hypothetical protein LBH98_06790 [Chitinispirillales bacterium]|jgi:hypothetical protein|nr:hypothetical protein [Chitinispirillales bacterium]